MSLNQQAVQTACYPDNIPLLASLLTQLPHKLNKSIKSFVAGLQNNTTLLPAALSDKNTTVVPAATEKVWIMI